MASDCAATLSSVSQRAAADPNRGAPPAGAWRVPGLGISGWLPAEILRTYGAPEQILTDNGKVLPRWRSRSDQARDVRV